MKNSCVILACIIFAFLIAGCGKSTESSGLEYKYTRENRNKQIHLRATLKSGDIVNVSLKSGWGIIEWMAEEGTMVASGDEVLRIDMEGIESQVRNDERNITSSHELFEKLKQVLPAEIAELQKNLRIKQLELDGVLLEQKWLDNKKDLDELWKIRSDLEIASMNFQLANKLYGLKKNITELGFDSPFALRTSEIDKKSRKIELDYAQRMLTQVYIPALPEEIAQINFKKAVASGEIWLAENQLVSASVSRQIRQKYVEVALDEHRASYRENKKSMEEAVKFAPRGGIIVHPILWGNFKFRVGQQAWEGVGILQVIADGKYFLEALVKESLAGPLFNQASVSIFLDSCPGREFKGEIKSIGKSPKIIRGARNSSFKFIPVEFSMPASESLLIGGKADIIVDLGTKEGVFLPRDIIVSQETENFVLLKTSFGTKQKKAELEDFDKDWVLWKNAPSDEGVLAYP